MTQSANHRRVCTLLLTGALAVIPTLAAAQPSAMSRAEQETLAGFKSEQAGELDAALAHYSKAVEMFPAAGVALRKGRLLVKLRRLIEARDVYRGIVERGVTATDSRELEQERKSVADATRELEDVKSRVPKLTIKVSGGKDPTVTLDGRALSAPELAAPREVDPGKHAIRVTAAGSRPEERSVDLAEGKSESVAIALQLEARPDGDGDGVPDDEDACKFEAGPRTSDPRTNGCPVKPVVPGASPPPPPPPRPVSRTPMIVAFSIGGAGLVTGSITGLLALGKASDLKSSCPSKVGCDQGTIDSGKTLGTVSTIAFVIGAAATGYGVYELLTFRPAADSRVGLRVGPGAAFFGGEFR